MAKKQNFNDFEGQKHFTVYVAAYGNIDYCASLEDAKKSAAKAAKSYPNRTICIYQAISFAEEEVTPLKWNDLA